MQMSARAPELNDSANQMAELFRLLGDPTRVRILLALGDTDELCVHEIAAAIDSTQTKVSQALRLLRTARLVTNRRDGRHVRYRLDDDHVSTVLSKAREHLDHDADHRNRTP